MRNPLNPLDWIHSAQDWFRRTERSSGFRPYLIFLLIHCGFAIVVLSAFREVEPVVRFVTTTLYITICGFVLLFAFKSIQEPAFCRSEKHIETVKRLELTLQKGDDSPHPIDVYDTKVIPNPENKRLSAGNGGAK